MAVKLVAMFLALTLALVGCAATPERQRGDELAVDAMYRDFDCAALATEAETLYLEIKRANEIADSGVGWIPIVNLFALPAQLQAIKDRDAAKARLGGVSRAWVERDCE